ncbi:MAG: T9SS type A sorting domain-containing protein [Bacteroidetes bacterium]|nr:T9SS type A sorting domain-containing protein [Bacteroidota bacterium]
MKKLLLSSFCLAFFFCQNTFAQLRCGTTEHEAYLRSMNPLYDQEKANLEKQLQEFIKKQQEERKLTGQETNAQYTIPIVFHVLWNTSAQNVTDTKVKAMLVQLNQDWSRTNTDKGNTPSYFATVAVDMQIQFCLATVDPSGNATTGIVHKQTSQTSFSSSGDPIKKSASGGDDPWNVNKYFNVWIGNLGGGLLGYGVFPPISSLYGVVIHYCTVGSLSSPGTCSPYGYGRTLSHEIGHCFNLYHIWGDDGGACTGTDNCNDTPNQADATAGCPSGVKTDNCTPSGNGIMYQNYMDYTDDACYNMFSNDQKTRAQSAVFNSLMSLANSSAAECAATGVAENSIVENISLYPNPSTGDVFIYVPQTGISTMDIKVYNAIGEAVVTKRITVPAETKINMNNNPDGIYLFEMRTPEGTVTKKVIINR